MMADTGWVIAGLGENESVEGGSNDWTTPENITNTSEAVLDWANSLGMKSGVSTGYLNASAFGFSIPGNSVIIGVQSRLRGGPGSTGSTFNPEHTMQLLVDGSRSGNNKADTSLPWPVGISNRDRGSPSDLWGTSLGPDDVNSSTFGISFRAINSGSGTRSIQIYTVWLRVHYEEKSGNAGAFFALFSVKDRLKEIIKPKKQFWVPEPIF